MAEDYYRNIISKIRRSYIYLYDADLDEDVKRLLLDSLRNQEIIISHQMKNKKEISIR